MKNRKRIPAKKVIAGFPPKRRKLVKVRAAELISRELAQRLRRAN